MTVISVSGLLLFLDGVYVSRDNQPPRFRRVKAPDRGELEILVRRISQRVGRGLERQGVLEQDAEQAVERLLVGHCCRKESLASTAGILESRSSWSTSVTPACTCSFKNCNSWWYRYLAVLRIP